MKDTRLYKTIKQLDIPQLSRFNKFMESPYFNVNTNQRLLLSFITTLIKKDLDAPSKESCWFSYNDPKTDFDDLKFRKICSDLLSKFETFLIHEYIKNDGLLEKNILLEQIQSNGFELMLNKAVDKAEKYFHRFPEKSSNFHLRKYEKGKIQYDIDTQFDKQKNKKTRDQLLKIDNLSESLDKYYVIEKLKMACTLATWQKKFKTLNRPFEVEIILRLLARNKLLETPAIAIYRNMYLMLTENPSLPYFQELKLLVKDFFEIFDSEEQRDIFDAMISYCVGEMNSGKSEFLEETLNLYDIAIGNSIILTNGELSPITFRNYILLCLRSTQYDKAEEFIQNNAKLLNDKLRENALNFNMARIAFYKKEWDNSIQFLSRVDYEDFLYDFNSRALSLAVYYELKEYDVLESQIESFTAFLARKKNISDNKTIVFKNFNRFLKKMITTNANEKEKLQNIRAQVKEEKAVINKAWLIEKIDELL